jgi:hypothetical protein
MSIGRAAVRRRSKKFDNPNTRKRQETLMRFMIIRQADATTEAGTMGTAQDFDTMGKYVEAMHAAGILRAADGLKPSSAGKRVKFTGGKPTVKDGPFAEAKELIAGYIVIDVPSLDEAVAWAKKWPATGFESNVELEIRPFFEASDFPPDVFTPEAAAKETKIREELEAKAKK